ncbi:MAG: hypothetical protein Q8P55_01670 [bacterium]|nr:hypothetical protein [bacterium]
MPTCNSCGEQFDINGEPGALLFSHPESVEKASMVKKYHLCQKCEKAIIGEFKHP